MSKAKLSHGADLVDSDLTRRLSEAREKAATVSDGGGIGTLSEKLLHRVLKFYAESDPACHEVPVLGCVADVLNADGITEIQTRAFEKMIPKLRRFLPQYKVTVIHPLINSVNIRYVDARSGELSSSRRSPRHDGVNRAACELYKIFDFISHPNFCVKLIFLNFDDFRCKGGEKLHTGGTNAAFRRVPVSVSAQTVLTEPSDYRIFLPSGLNTVFTASELRELIGLDSRRTHNTLSLLLSLGIIVREGRRGRAYVYRITDG